jgi:NADH:ubiquinone oxidoreductase subunit 5 (subunit L)/multisubunit Na+/H+ antiporter MnhA subunit
MDHLFYKLDIPALHGSVVTALFFLLVFFLLSLPYYRAYGVYVTNFVYVFLFIFFCYARQTFSGCTVFDHPQTRALASTSSAFLFFTTSGGVDMSLLLELSATTSEFSMLLLALALVINLYASHYFKKDPEMGRFSVLLFFFCFFMLLMINTTSWVFTFIAWEGVGLLSFFLVSFWFSKINTFKSGIKVLACNRLGDFFFFLSIGFILFFFKSDDILFTVDAGASSLYSSLQVYTNVPLSTAVAFALVLVILSKCAQFGFHIWLLEAMEAPLPASSLIHSATLVCVGVVLFLKTGVLIGGVASVTSFLVFWATLSAAALSWSALFNYDIKKILAYSTGSHVSIMLALCGCGEYGSTFAYMLVHASSKVFIFLLFGFIIDINRGNRDLRKMGGFFFSGSLANLVVVGLFFLSSFPVFALACLKDNLAVVLFRGPSILDLSLFLLMAATVGNYVYTFRLFLKIFFGDLLSLKGSYFTNFTATSKPNLILLSKKDRITFPVILLTPLVLYLFFLESTLFFSSIFDFSHSFFESVSQLSLYVPNGVFKYLALSNLFFYLLFFFRVLYRVSR